MSGRKTVMSAGAAGVALVVTMRLLTAAPAWSEPTPIDFPGARHTRPHAVSPTGVVSGVYVGQDGRSHGFLFDGGEFTTIDFPGATFTSAQGINAAGDVVGVYERPTDVDFQGYLYSQGNSLPIDIPGALNVRPFGINRQGDIVGGYVDANRRCHGFLIRQGELTTSIPPERSPERSSTSTRGATCSSATSSPPVCFTRSCSRTACSRHSTFLVPCPTAGWASAPTSIRTERS